MSLLKKTVKVGRKEINAEIMYLRLLAVNARKQVSLNQAMSFENSPVL